MTCEKCKMSFKNLDKKICFNCKNGLELINHRKVIGIRDKFSKEGLLYGIYHGQKSSAQRRRHPLPTYSLFALIEWCMNQKTYHKLFEAWEKSGYKHELVPSINRLDESKSYSFDNIELLSWGDHRKKGNGSSNKRVIQTDIDGNIINEYISCSEAGRQLGYRNGAINISLVARGKKDSYKGFKFIYPDD